MAFHSGFVTLAGRPNTGKSTLMNLLIGEKISIVSAKPQTTRNTIRCVLTQEDYQIVFLDTPGLHSPKSKLGQYMQKSAETALDEIDCLLYLVEPRDKISESDIAIIEKLKKAQSPVCLVINKIDTVPKDKLLTVIDRYKDKMQFAEIIPVSALKSQNIDRLLQAILQYLPEGPRYFPDDMITDQPERQIAAELIREKTLELMQDEVPHGIAVEVVMKKRQGRELVDTDATIYCERDSHKGMIIGKNGAMLKKIGSRARADIERLLGSQINLQLWVKVKKDWRDNERMLKMLDYWE